MFGHAQKEKLAKAEEEQQHEEQAEAEALAQETLRALDRGLALKRAAREKTAHFVGSLRPLVKGR